MRRLRGRGRGSTADDEEANLVGNDSVRTNDDDDDDAGDDIGREMTMATTTDAGYVVFQDPGMAGSNFDIGEAPSPDRVESPPPLANGLGASEPKEGDLASAAELLKARTPSPLQTEEASTKTTTDG